MLLCLSVWAKENVLHRVGFEHWDPVLLILQKRLHFVFHFSIRLLSVVSSFMVRHNGYVYETFGISEQFPAKLQRLLIRVKIFDKPLTAKCLYTMLAVRSSSFVTVNTLYQRFCQTYEEYTFQYYRHRDKLSIHSRQMMHP